MQTPADLIHFSRNMKSFIKGGEGVTITGEGTEQFPLIISSTGGDLTITDNDQQEVENVKTINFVGATVTDNEDGSVDVGYNGGGGGESLLKQAKVTVTPQQMLDLANNPVELIPAQGANTVINMISASMFLDFNSVAYNFVLPPDFSINGIEVAQLSGLEESDKITITIAPFSTYLGFNNPLLLTANANATQGDSPVTIIIDYTVHNYN